jgi:hypothetical protein
MLQMSQRDRDRLMVIRQVARKELTVTRGGELLGLCRESVSTAQPTSGGRAAT